MQIDLNQAEPRTKPFHAQVCIIGAGIAGLTLAHRLAQQGIDVALLEAGGLTLDPPVQAALASTPLTGTPHLGTHEGRFQVFGGASLRWGGQLLPMPSSATEALSSRPERSAVEGPEAPPAQPTPPWPIAPESLTPHYAAAEKLLAVDNLPYNANAFFAVTHFQPPALINQLPHLTPSLSKWTPFSHRNLASTIGRDLLDHPNVTVYLHAQATQLELAPARTHIQATQVCTFTGKTFRFEAQHFIVAAGTVETSRLLLASRSIAPEGVGNQHDQVGRNFHDHLTIPAAPLHGLARTALLSQLRPFVFGATQHSFKLEAAPQLREQLALNPVLAHLTFNEKPGSGLAAVRDLLHARQHGDFAATLRANISHLPSAAIEAFRLAASAKLHHRRFINASTTVTLQLNAAQDAPSPSRITLREDCDPNGLPQPMVDWRITPHELHTLRAFAAHLRESLATLSLDSGIDWQPALFDDNQPLANLEDARHAMGGACMGTDPRTSVVDSNLTVHGIANLHIAGAATFPDGSPQLITLPLMALALRLADHLAAQIVRAAK
jgi:choline dehydrogenase-like flavoprotein